MGLTIAHSAYIMKVYEYAYPSNNSELCHIMANVSSYMEVVRELIACLNLVHGHIMCCSIIM